MLVTFRVYKAKNSFPATTGVMEQRKYCKSSVTFLRQRPGIF